MTMQEAEWDLEERVEDALVSRIKDGQTDAVNVLASREVIKAEYPLVLVHVESSANTDETKPFDGRRNMTAQVQIMTMPRNEDGEDWDEAGQVSARAWHRKVKSAVIKMLAGNQVATDINTENPEGVLFSLCQMGELSRSSEGNRYVTTISMNTIAQPKEIT